MREGASSEFQAQKFQPLRPAPSSPLLCPRVRECPHLPLPKLSAPSSTWTPLPLSLPWYRSARQTALLGKKGHSSFLDEGRVTGPPARACPRSTGDLRAGGPGPLKPLTPPEQPFRSTADRLGAPRQLPGELGGSFRGIQSSCG